MSEAGDIPPVRGPVVAANGVVASEHPLATQTGIDVLQRGGNAFDAALAMSAVLPLLKPHRNHLGGDAYALVYPANERRVTAICSGGKAPEAAARERYDERVPQHGGTSIAVPGMVDAWQALHDGWCSMPLEGLLRPAIDYARNGVPASRELAMTFDYARGMFSKYGGLARLLYVDGSPLRMGQRLRQPDYARTLEAVASEGRRGFYEGAIGEKIAAGVREAGGFLAAEDLASHAAEVLEPLAVEYRGLTVYETPPNSQGLILLEELKIVEGYDLASWRHLSADAVHHMVEAKKLSFEDRQRFAGDPSFVDFDPQRLLSDEWAADRRHAIDPQQARRSDIPAASSDTTSFVIADRDGNVCSFIQSLFGHFGSGIVIDGAGIIMNNRMTGFSLDPSHPNALAPGKRTMHTLNTYLVFANGRPYIGGNTPGADYQVQTNLQVITGIIDFGLDAQQAVDAPRWGDTPDALLVEEEMPPTTQRELARRGHVVKAVPRTSNAMGRAQAIVIDGESGAYVGGSDSRGEGAAAGW